MDGHKKSIAELLREFKELNMRIMQSTALPQRERKLAAQKLKTLEIAKKLYGDV